MLHHTIECYGYVQLTIEYIHFPSAFREFKLSELEVATDNFAPENIIGRGGHSTVYKVCLFNFSIIHMIIAISSMGGQKKWQTKTGSK
jgi:hypothetical protein